MLKVGPGKKVSIYVGKTTSTRAPDYLAILELSVYRGVSGANVMRGVAGFGADHHVHTTPHRGAHGESAHENRVHRIAGKGRRTSAQAV